MTTFVYGIHAVRSFFRAGSGRPLRLLLKSGNLGPRLREIVGQAKTLDCEIEYCDRGHLDAIAANHQGVILYTDQSATPDVSLDSLIDASAGAPGVATPGAQRVFLVLDGITDPRNLGACIRSAATLGVTAVIAPRNNSAPLSPVAVKAACGGAELVPYYQVANIARSLETLRKAGFWVVGTVLEGGQPLAHVDLTGNLALVLGAEDKGLRRITREFCDYLATIPMVDDALGFNVSVATGICLYEIQRQRELAT